MNVIGIIPARLQSTRLPRKLLLAETGQPLLQHTYEAASAASSLDEVVIATDSEEIRDTAVAFGARCEMTGDHPSGTDRIAEVVGRCFPHADIIVNVQGDEPEIAQSAINRLVDLLQENPDDEMATLSTPIRCREELESASCTKVVTAGDGRALYFSRSPIPFVRDASIDELLAGETPWRLHLGLYAYRRDFLLRLAKQSPTPLEQFEKLEQLRALELGAVIRAATVDQRTVGIDTPADYARFVARYSDRQRRRAA